MHATQLFLFFLKHNIKYQLRKTRTRIPYKEYFEWNHVMVEVGREVWRLSSPSPCKKHGELERVAWNLVQLGLSISRGGDSTTSMGNLFQCWTTLTVFF